MLQYNNASAHAISEQEPSGLDLAYFWGVLKRRWLLLFAPIVLVAAVGTAVVLWLPPIYLSEGKILVESQQIPVDLVKPTVTAGAKERIQVIEQRVMTRDNLLAIVKKFDLFADKRDTLSSSDLVDLMRQSAFIQPIELDSRRRNDGLTVALNVGFEHERPDMAMRVANELMTLILNEDARNRANRAAETTRFLAREVSRIEAALSALDGQITELRRRKTVVATNEVQEKLAVQLAGLRAELNAKSAIYAKTHPEMVRLRRQIEAFEKAAESQPAAPQAPASADPTPEGLDTLLNQRENLQKNLESATQKLAVARLGESLESQQFSERLEVIDQAVVPQKPIKPNRRKLLALVFGLAGFCGVGSVAAAEMLNSRIRSSRELASIIDPHLLVPIPYIATKAELRIRTVKVASYLLIVAGAIGGGLYAVDTYVRPLDLLWSAALARLAL